MADGGLPDELRSWVETTTGGAVVRADRHLAGASRQAWAVDVGATTASSSSSCSATSGAVVGRHAMPRCSPHWLHRRSDTRRSTVRTRRCGWCCWSASTAQRVRDVDDVARARRPAPDGGRRHAAPHRPLGARHRPPRPPDASADHCRGAARARSRTWPPSWATHCHPLFSRRHRRWLRRTGRPGPVAPRSSTAISGPGNLIHRDGRIRALLDWEVAHWGDPMEDLAALAVRDMATPVGDLRTRFAEYERHGGPPVEPLDRRLVPDPDPRPQRHAHRARAVVRRSRDRSCAAHDVPAAADACPRPGPLRCRRRGPRPTEAPFDESPPTDRSAARGPRPPRPRRRPSGQRSPTPSPANAPPE